MNRVRVRHGTGEYDVVIGINAVDEDDLRNLIGERPVLIVTDENVAPLWLDAFREKLPAGESLMLPAGEPAKTLEGVSRIWSTLAGKGFGRDVVLLALGGGVIGDMTGFAAACWMRGVDFIQLPTTLLAQVDASVGGKTAVDLPAGKNLVGAFHQPLAVFADTRTLDTLPERELAAGFAEVVKAALLADATFFDWLEANAASLLAREPDAMTHAIRRSCEIKAAIVEEDEREQGRRTLLNLGHTFAHALENVTRYERFLHGEAVAVGLMLAAAMSEQQCGLDHALRPRLRTLLRAFRLPADLPDDISHDAILHAMRLDKKHTHARWRLVLLKATGQGVVREFDNPAPIERALGAGHTGAT